MARLADSVLKTGLWLLRGLTVLCALVVAGLLIWFASAQPPPLVKSEAALPPAETAPVVEAAAAPESEPKEVAPWVPPAGPTKFVRRLAAGAALRSLREEAGNGAAPETLLERFHRLTPFLLRADGYRRMPPVRRENLIMHLGFLTEPARDLESVHRIRGDGPVRFWSLRKTAWRPEFDRAQRMIGHIEDVAGTDLPYGYDLLLAPKRGEEIFPGQWKPPFDASGIYFIRDQYCVVKSGMRPAWRELVIKHELVHAYCRQFTDRFISSRFVSEGLAEYLSRCAPTDDGFAAPAHLYADNLARLDSMLRWMGGKPRLAALVKLAPWQFYALRSFGYLMAQAAMAYLDPKIIERAFREKSDRAIVAAIGAIDGREFLRFVRDRGKSGAPENAFAVEDVAPRGPTGSKETTVHLLRRLGLTADRGLTAKSLSIGAAKIVTNPERVAKILDLILRDADRRWKRTLVIETSAAMDRAIELGPLPESLARYGLAATTPREFVRRFHQILYQSRPVDVISLDRQATAGTYGLPEAPSPYELNSKALSRSGPRSLILCVASRTEDEETWTRLYEAYREPSSAAPETVLVIDLSDGDGDARRLARFFATLPGSSTAVVYWAPVRRRKGKR